MKEECLICSAPLEYLTQILRESKNVVFFGGAGMSTESGVPDFRSANGIYSRRLHQEFRPEEMASHSFFVNHTEAFFEFYREHRIFRNSGTFSPMQGISRWRNWSGAAF